LTALTLCDSVTKSTEQADHSEGVYVKIRVACAALVSVCLLAQVPTGEFTGTITDPTGAVVAGATVSVSNPATGVQRSVVTNENGNYSVPALPPGSYNIRVERQGFNSQARNGVELQVAQVARLDFAPQIGNVAEVIEVVGGAPVLDTETTELGTVIEKRRILELPLNGRDYLQLASLTPGATTNGPASSQGQQRMGVRATSSR
jgi:hypothetical protein